MKKETKSCNLLLLMMMAAFMLVVSACGGDTGKSVRNTEKLVIASTDVSGNINPMDAWNGWYTVRYGIGETLFRIGDDLSIEPWLAESYKNIDPLTWEIKLADGNKFSNGQDVTVEKVIASLKKTGSDHMGSDVLKNAEFTAKDGRTLVIKTKNPCPALINDLTDPCTTIVDVEGTKDMNIAPVCTGSFKVGSYTPTKKIVMIPNEFAKVKPVLKEVTYRAIPDVNTMSMALESGEIDAAYNLNVEAAETLKAAKDIDVVQRATTRVYEIMFDESKMDKNLRKAILLSIDKEKICHDLLRDSVTKARTAFPEGSFYAGDNLNIPSYDPVAAKKILTDAGYKDTDGDGILEKNGKPLKLKFTTYKRIAQEDIATEIQAELKKTGIDVELKIGEKFNIIEEGGYDFCMVCLVTAPTGDPGYFMTKRFGKNGALNYTKTNDPQLEALAKELAVTYDKNKKLAIVDKIQQRAADEAYTDYIGFNNMLMAHKKDVSGLRLATSDYYQLSGAVKITK